jgi:hypothetical protein
VTQPWRRFSRGAEREVVSGAREAIPLGYTGRCYSRSCINPGTGCQTVSGRIRWPPGASGRPVRIQEEDHLIKF